MRLRVQRFLLCTDNDFAHASVSGSEGAAAVIASGGLCPKSVKGAEHAGHNMAQAEARVSKGFGFCQNPDPEPSLTVGLSAWEGFGEPLFGQSSLDVSRALLQFDKEKTAIMLHRRLWLL
jgi:hypothetical protein